ncbi:MAG: hypothetical protein V4650_07585 [Pseudomonadota bacterium]
MCIPLLLALLPQAARAAPVVTLADIAIGNDDNIVSARDGLPRSTEQFLHGGIAAAFSTPLDAGLSLRLQARLDGRLHARYEGLNELDAGLEGQLLLRPGSGFYTPTLGLAMHIGSQQFQSDLRDSLESQLRLTLREAITTRISLRGELFTSWRGSESTVFDSHLKGGELALDWLAAPALTLTLGYQYQAGDVVSIGRPGASARANARALQMDDVFEGLTALRFDAQTHIGLVAASYALTPALAIDVQCRYVESDSGFDTRYHRWITSSGLVARF